MLIYVDKAIELRLTGLTIGNDTTTVPVMSKDAHAELRDEQPYPAITFQRIDRVFDVSRHTNDKQVIGRTDDEGVDVVDIYASPNPYNIIYQIELLAKERYDMDMLQLLFDSKINPRGDMLEVQCYIDEVEIGKDHEVKIKFPLLFIERRTLDDYTDAKNVYYRWIATVSVGILHDPLVIEKLGEYVIRNDVGVQEIEK
jgi:hypothetical protein